MSQIMNTDSPPEAPPRKYIPESFIAAPLLFLTVYLALGGMVKFSPFSSLMWGVVYLVGFGWMLITLRRTLMLLGRFWPLLLLPAMALISAFWSEDVAKTIRTGIQFTFSTILAVRFGAALTPTTATNSVFLATLLGFCLSVLALVAPPLQPAFEYFNDAFIGIYVQKTVAGLALAIFVMALCARGAIGNFRVASILLAICVLPFVALTKSVSAFVVLGCLSIILVQGLVKHREATTRFAILILTGLFVVTSMLTLWIDRFDLAAFLLESVGKSTTLTGRTDIWQLGIELTEDYPLLGFGYAAFWGNPVFAEEWGFIHASIDPRLNGFHSLYVEALASTGIVSVVMIVLVYYWTLLRSLSWFLASGSAEAAFWLAIMTSAIAVSFVDNVLYAEHEFFHMMATMIFVFTGLHAPRLKWRLFQPRPVVRTI